MMQRSRALTGNKYGSPVVPKAMTSPQTSFFWFPKLRYQKKEERSYLSVSVISLSRRPPMKSWTYGRVKGMVSEGLEVYLLGLRSKIKLG